MDRNRFVEGVVIGAFLMLVVNLVFIFREGGSEGKVVRRDTVRVEVTDTIRYYEPVARDSAVVRYVTKVLPVSSRESRDESRRTETGAAMNRDGQRQEAVMGHGARELGDSIAVEVPISQKKYETERYRAYVSGYEPSLDSIFVYQKTVTERVVVTQQAKQQRIGVCVVGGFGYGVTSRKPDVFVGIGFYLRL